MLEANVFTVGVTELYFYGGIALMTIAVILAVICIVLFIVSGRRLKWKLEQDYGRPSSGKVLKRSK